MRAEFQIRRAESADAVAIAHVHRLSRADYYDVPAEVDDGREAMWAHLLDQPGRVTQVAEESGTVVGFLSACAHEREDDPVEELELTALYVLPTHVGRRIGSRLHRVFTADLLGGSSGTLEVWAGNGRAIDFYRHRGWVATSSTRPGPQDRDFVTYRLPVGGFIAPPD